MEQPKKVIERLAYQYSNASGIAYSRGEDQLAAQYREAAKKLIDLAAELPSIEAITR